MIKKIVIIILSIAALLMLDLVFRPYLRQRDAVKVIKTVLTHWENGNLTLAMPYWVKENNSPPVFGLTGYEIEVKTFTKIAGTQTAQISATLDFSPNNPMPSGRIWIFELEKSRYGWKITDFRLAKNNPLQ